MRLRDRGRVRGGRPSRGGGHRARLGRPLRRWLAGRRTGHRRDRGDRLCGGRDRPRPARHGAAAPARPGGRCHRRPRRRRADALGRAVDLVVDRRRPVVELARPRPRLPRVPRARSCSRERCRRGARRVAALLALVVGVAIGWALLGVAIPSLFPDGDRIARLREPVGYWNALALLADAALALGLWVARSRRVAGPGRGRLLVYGGVLAVLLTQSRAGVVGPLAVVVLWLVLRTSGSADALRAVVAAGPRSLVGGWAFTRPALVEDGVLRADRVADGKVFAALTVVGAIASLSRHGGSHPSRLVARRGRPCEGCSSPFARSCSSSPAVGLVAKVGEPLLVGGRRSSRAASASTTRDGSPTSARTTGSPWWREALDIAPTGRSEAPAPGRSRSHGAGTGRAHAGVPSRTASPSSCSATWGSSASPCSQRQSSVQSSASAAGCGSPTRAIGAPQQRSPRWCSRSASTPSSTTTSTSSRCPLRR